MTEITDKYKTVSEAPVAWRTVRGVPLQLYQLNDIIVRAEEAPDLFPVALGRIRAEFEKSHEIKNGQWSPVEVH
ncbi:MAG: hypothetical protein AB9Q17_02410 [Candidatus Reddybacter sp.]